MKNKKVLIVEDDEVIRKVLKVTLGKWGFQVEEGEDGLQALHKLENEPFRLIICDIMMPNMNGWELMKRVRQNPDTQDIPIIALTAKNKDADMFKGFEMGANYYITKPFTKAQLRYGIQLVLDQHTEEANEIDLSTQFENENQ
ncbi:MAG: response regulator [Deltaproteobacteria bacterium]|nr:MAG: response regulator [Deltaproteobacteria bacterium]